MWAPSPGGSQEPCSWKHLWAKGTKWGWAPRVGPPRSMRLQEPPGRARGLRWHLSDTAHPLQRECPLRVLPEAFPRTQTHRGTLESVLDWMSVFLGFHSMSVPPSLHL